MSQPPPYSRQFDFTDFSASNPSAQQPGVSLDAEYEALRTTIAAVLANIALIQRDDGALANQLVTLDSMDSAAIIALAGAWTPRGAWLTATAYALSDVVSSTTKTYVCAVAHTSGVLATDVAAGKWVLIFDSAGATPADGSVSTAKLADGAVTTAKIGFTSLDLASTIRAGGGLSAGTAAIGAGINLKLAAGDVLMKAERTTADQGVVGYKAIGVNVDWTLAIGDDVTDYVLEPSAGGGKTTWSAAGALDQTGSVRALGTTTPTTGAGVIVRYASSTGFVDSYDYAGVVWKDLKLRGLITYITANAIDVVKATSTGVEVKGTLKKGSSFGSTVEVGLSGLPTSAQGVGSTIQLAAADVDHRVPNTLGGWNIPAGIFSDGNSFVLQNRSATAQALTCASGTLYKAGTSTTGTLSVLPRGLVLVVMDGSDFTASGNLG